MLLTCAERPTDGYRVLMLKPRNTYLQATRASE
jgi:hypothetical protein